MFQKVVEYVRSSLAEGTLDDAMRKRLYAVVEKYNETHPESPVSLGGLS